MKFKSNTGLVKAAPVEHIKALNETGEFEGYASIFGEMDQGRDIVLSGAFRNSLIKRPADRIKMLWQHDRDKIIGRWMEIREDNRGLYVKGKLILGIEKGREAHELMMAGALDGMSIGYRTVVDEYDRDTETRRLKEVDLREVSLVTFPMLESATVALVKGDDLPTEREVEDWLKGAGFSSKQAKVIISQGYKALRPNDDTAESDSDIARMLKELASTIKG